MAAGRPRIHQHRVREIFLRMVSFAYFAAFASLYVQVPGLYGDDGLMPVAAFIERHRGSVQHDRLGLRADEWLGAQALLGCACASIAVAGCATAPVLLILWLLFASCFTVGQTFLSFQWDLLLLEVGAQATLLAPLIRSPRATNAPMPSAVVCVLRFTLFKLMIMSGAVKLQAHCPAWDSLTALAYHFATQCIPTPLAWHAHHLPLLLLKAAVAATLVIELPAAVLLIVPSRPARALGAWLQGVLQVLIALTGNYNFFNLTTAALCLLLLDDDLLPFARAPPPPMYTVELPLIGNRLLSIRRRWQRVEAPLVLASATAFLVACTCAMFHAEFAADDEPPPRLPLALDGRTTDLVSWLPAAWQRLVPTDLRLTLTAAQMQRVLDSWLPPICDGWLPALLCCHVLLDLLRCLRDHSVHNESFTESFTAEPGARRVDSAFFGQPRALPTAGRGWRSVQSGARAAWLLLVSGCACLLYAGSVPHFAEVAASSMGERPEWQVREHDASRRVHLSSGYGLFRRMTGIGTATRSAKEASEGQDAQ